MGSSSSVPSAATVRSKQEEPVAANISSSDKQLTQQADTSDVPCDPPIPPLMSSSIVSACGNDGFESSSRRTSVTFLPKVLVAVDGDGDDKELGRSRSSSSTTPNVRSPTLKAAERPLLADGVPYFLQQARRN